MRAEVFFVIQRVKDGLYYVETLDNGERLFASVLSEAHEFDNRQEAKDMIKAMQNWLGRPKFKLITGQHITR